MRRGFDRAPARLRADPRVRLDAAGNVAGHDIEAQVRAAFENVRLVLEAAGSSWDRIVDVTVFLTDMKRDFSTFNRVWGEFFKANPPARTTVEVGAASKSCQAVVSLVARSQPAPFQVYFRFWIS